MGRSGPGRLWLTVYYLVPILDPAEADISLRGLEESPWLLGDKHYFTHFVENKPKAQKVK